MDLDGKTVVLTGATGGIGRPIASRLSEEGARLILVARNKQRLAGLVEELGSTEHIFVAADLCDAEGRNRVVSACQADRNADLSLLINASGINEFGLFENQTSASLQRMIEVNLLNPMLLIHEFLPLLKKQKCARIINVGSTFGSIGYPGFAGYCASKFGLRGFTEALRRELADTNIRVSYVAPRATRTDLNCDNVVAMNQELGTTMDEPSLVAEEFMRVVQKLDNNDAFFGWPEKLFVRINALFPKIVDSSLRKQLPTIRNFATDRQ